MRTIKATRSFRQDRRRVARGVRRNTIDAELTEIVDLLRRDSVIPERFGDHPMHGRWRGYRNCHIHGDLALLYRKIGDDVLELVGLGSHSQLGL